MSDIGDKLTVRPNRPIRRVLVKSFHSITLMYGQLKLVARAGDWRGGSALKAFPNAAGRGILGPTAMGSMVHENYQFHLFGGAERVFNKELAGGSRRCPPGRLRLCRPSGAPGFERVIQAGRGSVARARWTPCSTPRENACAAKFGRSLPYYGPATWHPCQRRRAWTYRANSGRPAACGPGPRQWRARDGARRRNKPRNS